MYVWISASSRNFSDSQVVQPVIHECDKPVDLNVTVKWMYEIIFKLEPLNVCPFSIFSWIDVRDVAKAHVKAMEDPISAGQRFIASNGLS